MPPCFYHFVFYIGIESNHFSADHMFKAGFSTICKSLLNPKFISFPFPFKSILLRLSGIEKDQIEINSLGKTNDLGLSNFFFKSICGFFFMLEKVIATCQARSKR